MSDSPINASIRETSTWQINKSEHMYTELNTKWQTQTSPFRSALPIGTLRGININPRLDNRNTHLRLTIPTRTEKKRLHLKQAVCQCFGRKEKNNAKKRIASQFKASWSHQGVSKLKGEEHQIALLPLLRVRLKGGAYPHRDYGVLEKRRPRSAPERVAEMESIPCKGLRVALMLNFPKPHPPFLLFLCSLKIIYCGLSTVSQGVGRKYIAGGPNRRGREISEGPTQNIYVCAKMIKWFCSIRGQTVHCCSCEKNRSMFSISRRLQFSVIRNIPTD
jgi:hypothetical protein